MFLVKGLLGGGGGGGGAGGALPGGIGSVLGGLLSGGGGGGAGGAMGVLGGVISAISEAAAHYNPEPPPPPCPHLHGRCQRERGGSAVPAPLHPSWPGGHGGEPHRAHEHPQQGRHPPSRPEDGRVRAGHVPEHGGRHGQRHHREIGVRGVQVPLEQHQEVAGEHPKRLFLGEGGGPKNRDGNPKIMGGEVEVEWGPEIGGLRVKEEPKNGGKRENWGRSQNL
ncbi:serine/threonine-protein phosphatase 1 regulatory subunit 10-like isoform X2 [Agelaius tricolor]|uniref:serine/threonine-protein phosphatase 1 regulatory subunit 10-like isoform X2 n=1 Tax=Agelaius tricolor TaxID=9191 RepID=UPI0039F22658